MSKPLAHKANLSLKFYSRFCQRAQIVFTSFTLCNTFSTLVSLHIYIKNTLDEGSSVFPFRTTIFSQPRLSLPCVDKNFNFTSITKQHSTTLFAEYLGKSSLCGPFCTMLPHVVLRRRDQPRRFRGPFSFAYCIKRLIFLNLPPISYFSTPQTSISYKNSSVSYQDSSLSIANLLLPTAIRNQKSCRTLSQLQTLT
jgi:hypothetical protein